MSSSIFSFGTLRLLRNAKSRNAHAAAIMSATIGASSRTKSMNESPAALPIMMFGGSPMRVAVPPIFEENTSVIKNGPGLISSFSAIANVMGIARMTVVTLSRNALTKAVKNASAGRIRTGLPRVRESVFAAA